MPTLLTRDEAHAEFLTLRRQSVFAPYEDVVRRVAAERGLTLVDLTEDFTAPSPEPLYFDETHPNARGHELVARRLGEALATPPARP